MTTDECFELLENAVDKLYPDLTEDSLFSDSGSEKGPSDYGQKNLWVQFENVKPYYIQKWLEDYKEFAKPFEEWAKEQEFITCSIMGDSATRTLTFELVTICPD